MVGFKEIQEEEERASTAKHSVKPGPGEGTGCKGRGGGSVRMHEHSSFFFGSSAQFDIRSTTLQQSQAVGNHSSIKTLRAVAPSAKMGCA